MGSCDWLLHCVMDVPFGRIVLFHFSSKLKFWVVRGHMELQSLSFINGSNEEHLNTFKL